MMRTALCQVPELRTQPDRELQDIVFVFWAASGGVQQVREPEACAAPLGGANASTAAASPSDSATIAQADLGERGRPLLRRSSTARSNPSSTTHCDPSRSAGSDPVAIL